MITFAAWSAMIAALLVLKGTLIESPLPAGWFSFTAFAGLLAITFSSRLRDRIGCEPATDNELRYHSVMVVAAVATLGSLSGGGTGSAAVLLLVFPLILASPWFGWERNLAHALALFLAHMLIEVLVLGRVVGVVSSALSLAAIAAVLLLVIQRSGQLSSSHMIAALRGKTGDILQRTSPTTAEPAPSRGGSGVVGSIAALIERSRGDARVTQRAQPDSGADSGVAGTAGTAGGSEEVWVDNNPLALQDPELVDRRPRIGSRQWWRTGSENRVVAEYLMDVRASTGADEAVVWVLGDGDSVLRPLAACSSNKWAERSNADEKWIALVRWSCEAAVTQMGTLEDGGGYLSAPISVDGKLLGVLCLRRVSPFNEVEAVAKARTAHHAQCVARIVSLIHSHRSALARSTTLDAAMEAVRQLQDRAPVESPASAICDAILQVCACDASALIRWDLDTATGVVEAGAGSLERIEGAMVSAASIIGRTCERGTALRMPSAADILGRMKLVVPGEVVDEIGSFIAQPMKREGHVIGALVAAWNSPTDAVGPSAASMEVLGSVAAHALFTSWALESIQVTARTDALTGLSNRRFLDEQMDRVLAESTRYGDPAALILLDLDYFKAINDTHGHSVGDQVLRHVAATLQEGVRGVDVCARYGGEELAVLLPRTGLQGAVELAERLREALEKCPLQVNGSPLQITASFGVASFPKDAPTSQALLTCADSALYRAKLAGRNRVRSAQARL